MSVDEKTGMQALERLHASKPARPGLVERIEFEYHRHGTLCLIANFEVATGKIISPTLGPTRTEADFAAHIEATIATDADARWIFVADQLDTHRLPAASMRRNPTHAPITGGRWEDSLVMIEIALPPRVASASQPA